MTDRQRWEHATGRSRYLAIAADTELRRRYPDQKIKPLRSAEPALGSDTEHEQLHPTPDGKLITTAGWIRELAAQHRAFREKMDERLRPMKPGEDLAWPGIGLPAWWAPHPDAILQPPKPEITPSARIIELAAEHDAEPEAGG